jgi:hypothetical protein
MDIIKQGGDFIKQGNDILKQITETAFGSGEPETLEDVKKLLQSKYELEKICGLKHAISVFHVLFTRKAHEQEPFFHD